MKRFCKDCALFENGCSINDISIPCNFVPKRTASDLITEIIVCTIASIAFAATITILFL